MILVKHSRKTKDDLMKPTDLKPPFDFSVATQKVQMAENAWNTRDPEKVSMAYTIDSVWRNRSDHFQGRDAIVSFTTMFDKNHGK